MREIGSSLKRLAVLAGEFTSLQLEPHRFLKRRQLWICLMHCSFRTSPGRNDEAVCLIDSVESHVPKEDDTRKVDIRIVRASSASEPSLQEMARADWDSAHAARSWPSRTIRSRRCLFRCVIEDILLKLLHCAEGFMRRPSMNIHQLLNQSIRGLSDRGANGIDNHVVPRECRQP